MKKLKHEGQWKLCSLLKVTQHRDSNSGTQNPGATISTVAAQQHTISPINSFSILALYPFT